jgi:hypothetical protein
MEKNPANMKSFFIVSVPAANIQILSVFVKGWVAFRTGLPRMLNASFFLK